MVISKCCHRMFQKSDLEQQEVQKTWYIRSWRRNPNLLMDRVKALRDQSYVSDKTKGFISMATDKKLEANSTAFK